MTDKLFVCLLDALGPINMYEHQGFQVIRDKYFNNGDVLGISTIPHTAASNPMIWGGVSNEDKFWIDARDQWIDPAMFFNRDTGTVYEEKTEHGQPVPDGVRAYTRHDYNDTFIWDDLDQAGKDAVAIQVPIVLPPYSFNASRELTDSWFPDTAPRMEKHIREKPKICMEHMEEGHDLIATSIQMPDKWRHGMAEGKCSKEFVSREERELDSQIHKIIEFAEAHEYDWIFAGDHGSPWPGSMPMKKAKEILPRHRKEAVIFSNLEEFPSYTDEFYPFMLDYFGISEGTPENREQEQPDVGQSEVMERLGNLGYLDT